MRNFKTTLILILGLMLHNSYSNEVFREDVNLDSIIQVLKFVESENNPKAIGDQGRSYGILQIQKIAIEDVNKRYGTNYIHQDAFKVNCAEEIFKLYVTMWSEHLYKKEKRKVRVEDIVRIWNGGPRGYLKDATEWYLRKFKKYRKYLNLC